MKKEEYIEKYGLEAYQRRLEQKRNYNLQHRKERSDYLKQRNNTLMGRAMKLINNYKRKDKLQGRGVCTLTPQWIVNNIFSSKCIYCGCSDWKQLGCDRIDNTKPHTEDNVVCSCWNCNNERNQIAFGDYLQQKGNGVIRVYY